MIHLGSIRGTTIGVDPSFLILITFFVVSYYDPARGIEYALLWAPVLFISVLVHEFAHAAAIGAFGYGASEIVLGGMGGVTRSHSHREGKAWHELIISLAGPLSSFGLALLFAQIATNVPFARTDRMMIALMPLLIGMNWWWGYFNLLPISPLDGGHAVRHLLRLFLSEARAFQIAVWIAIVSGVAVIAWAISQQNILLAALIAWFVMVNYQQWQYYRDHGTPGD